MTLVSWEPLAEHDPVPGDPWEIQALGRHFAERAATIRSVIATLGRLDPGDQVNAAAKALAQRRDEVLPDLALLASRYERTTTALRRYAPALEQAQDMAGRARSGAVAAHAQAEHARRALLVEAQGLSLEPGVSPGAWQSELDDAEAALRAARRLLDEALALRDEAANRCAAEIGFAAHDELQDDALALIVGTPVAALDWVVDHLDHLEDFSDALGLAAAGLGLAGLAFPPLGITAAAVGAVKLGIDTHLAATDQAGWGEVAFGAVSLAIFGVGRVYTAAARGTAGAAAQQRVEVFRQAIGRAGALRGMSGITRQGRVLRGASLRSYGLKHYPLATREFGTKSGNLLPRGRHWVEAVTRWKGFELPGREILSLSSRATAFRYVVWGSHGIGAALDANQLAGQQGRKLLTGDVGSAGSAHPGARS